MGRWREDKRKWAINLPNSPPRLAWAISCVVQFWNSHGDPRGKPHAPSAGSHLIIEQEMECNERIREAAVQREVG
jgi:hypothetical protein